MRLRSLIGFALNAFIFTSQPDGLEGFQKIQNCSGNIANSSRQQSLSSEISDYQYQASCRGESKAEIEKKIADIKKARELPSCSIVPPRLAAVDSAVVSYLYNKDENFEKSLNDIENALKAATKIDINRVLVTPDDLFQFISMTKTGRKYLNQIPQNRSDIKIVLGEPAMLHLGAFTAMYVDEEKTIYLNKWSPIGVLAPIFLHELTHALNTSAHQVAQDCKTHLALATSQYYPEVYKMFNKSKKSIKDLTNLLLDSGAGERFINDHFTKCMSISDYLDERNAYDAQYTFIQELRLQSACYGKWINIQEKDGQIAAARFTDEEIMSHYPDLIDADTVRTYAATRNLKLTAPEKLEDTTHCQSSPTGQGQFR